jgi:hypothetical protein
MPLDRRRFRVNPRLLPGVEAIVQGIVRVYLRWAALSAP